MTTDQSDARAEFLIIFDALKRHEQILHKMKVDSEDSALLSIRDPENL
jgi:hypothetical protein